MFRHVHMRGNNKAGGGCTIVILQPTMPRDDDSNVMTIATDTHFICDCTSGAPYPYRDFRLAT